jgi:hypothetical protein
MANLRKSIAKRSVKLINSTHKFDFFASYLPDYLEKGENLALYYDLLAEWTKHDPTNNQGDISRLHAFILQVQSLKLRSIKGEIAELGVFQGTSAKIFKMLLPNKKLYLFDTFDGLAEKDIESDENATATAGDFSCDLNSVKRYVGTEGVNYFPGYFPDSTKDLAKDIKFSLVHLDADLYDPQKAGLEFFYPRLSPGGVIFLHDCNNAWEGSRRALDEFCQSIPENPCFVPDKAGSGILIKNS